MEILEKNLQTKILKYLQNSKIYSVKIISANKNGIPDIICCLNGRFIGIEVKIKPNKLTALQKYNLNKIKEAGGISFVAYSLDDVKRNLKDLLVY